MCIPKACKDRFLFFVIECSENIEPDHSIGRKRGYGDRIAKATRRVGHQEGKRCLSKQTLYGRPWGVVEVVGVVALS